MRLPSGDQTGDSSDARRRILTARGRAPLARRSVWSNPSRTKTIVRPVGAQAGSRSQRSQLRVSRTALPVGLTRSLRIDAAV